MVLEDKKAYQDWKFDSELVTGEEYEMCLGGADSTKSVHLTTRYEVLMGRAEIVQPCALRQEQRNTPDAHVNISGE